MSEAGRLQRKLECIRAAERAAQLAKLRAITCAAACGPTPNLRHFTPLESDNLERQVTNCYTYIGPVQGVPESVRINRVTELTLLKSTDPENPDARFSEYRGPFIPPVCPALPPPPKPLGSTRCPLPNAPWNPILPA